MRKIKLTVLATALMASILLTSCTGANSTIKDPADERLQVYSSFYTMYDFAKLIAGDEVDLHNLVPFGVEAHDWEPSPQDIVNLEQADVFIYNGLGMESWVDDVLEGLENEDLLVIQTGEDLLDETVHVDEDDHEDEHADEDDHEDEHADEDDHEDGHSHSGADPHVWLDPYKALAQMETIHDALVTLQPESKAVFDANLAMVTAEVEKLDAEFHAVFDVSKHKSFIVEHEAFYYLAAAYDLEQIGINSVHGSEPDPKQLATVIDRAKESGISTVFYEGVEASNMTIMLATDLGGQTLRLNPFEGLSEEEIEAGKNYFTVMRENLAALEEGLN